MTLIITLPESLIKVARVSTNTLSSVSSNRAIHRAQNDAAATIPKHRIYRPDNKFKSSKVTNSGTSVLINANLRNAVEHVTLNEARLARLVHLEHVQLTMYVNKWPSAQECFF